MNYTLDATSVIDILVSLQSEIKTLIDASIPNKQQSKAAQTIAADYFSKTREYVATMAEKNSL